MGNKMRDCYFLRRLGFFILGLLFHGSQEIGSMEETVDISMVSSSSKSSLGVENDPRLNFRGKDCGLFINTQNKAFSLNFGNKEDSSLMDCSASPKKERKSKAATFDWKLSKEYTRSKKGGRISLEIKDVEKVNSLSSMDCCSGSPVDTNLSISDSFKDIFQKNSEQMMQGEKPRKHSIDAKLEAMISTDGFVEASNVLAFWTSGSNKFTHIKIRGKMTNEDIAKLCTWEPPTNLKEVNWGQSSGMPLLFQQILRCHWDQSLMVLDLTDEDIKNPISGYIALALTKNQRLTTLNVHLNDKSVHGNWIEDIIDPLIAHKALKTIDLSHSMLGCFGKAIAKIMVGNTTVAEFKLSHCALLHKDIGKILQALKKLKR